MSRYVIQLLSDTAGGISPEVRALILAGSQGSLLGGGGIYMQNQCEVHIILIKGESKEQLRFPGSIWDAERDTAVFLTLLSERRNLKVLLLLLIQL